MSYAANKKWRNTHRDIWARGKGRNYAKGARHLTLAERYAKRRWSRGEIAAITEPTAMTDRELAVILHRSVRAIQIKRSRVGRTSIQEIR